MNKVMSRIKRSYFEVRPTKSALYRVISRNIKRARLINDLGIDMACARFDHRELFFPVKTYIGLDLHEERLREGLRKYPNDYGILCDICSVVLPEGCADLVISTNTLFWISDEHKRFKAVQTMSKAVHPSGMLIIEMLNDNTVPKAQALLEKTFDAVELRYIGNRLAVIYNRIITRKKDRYPYVIAHTFPLRILSAILGSIENCRYAPHKRHALFICEKKKGKNVHPLHLDTQFDTIGLHIYKQKGLADSAI